MYLTVYYKKVSSLHNMPFEVIFRKFEYCNLSLMFVYVSIINAIKSSFKKEQSNCTERKMYKYNNNLLAISRTFSVSYSPTFTFVFSLVSDTLRQICMQKHLNIFTTLISSPRLSKQMVMKMVRLRN